MEELMGDLAIRRCGNGWAYCDGCCMNCEIAIRRTTTSTSDKFSEFDDFWKRKGENA